MNDLVRELRSAELDWIDCDDAENAALARDAANRIEALEKALTRAEKLLTGHAAKVGQLHSWWDDIFDIREILK